jgi:hypothetical protein
VQPDPSNQQKPQVQVQQPEQKVETKVVKPKTWRQMTPPGPNTDSSLSTPTRLKGDGRAVVTMSYDKKTFFSTKQLQNGIRADVKKLFDLPGFPYYEDNMFTESGLPYYTTFAKDERAACEHLDEEELEECTNDRLSFRRVANHLYADGPLKVSAQEGEGITDLKEFILATCGDPKTQRLMQ